MNLLTSLQDLIRSPQPHATEEEFRLPHSLTQGEWIALKRLSLHEGYPVFLKVLDSIARLSVEGMLASSSDDASRFLRGKVMGLRKAGLVIEEIKRDEERYAKTKEALANVGSRDAERKSALYGTPGWRPQSRRDSA